ncbi:hypothetical protein [Sphingomonas sp. OTU376]|uniref:hypothetical protein n=1 Tax=Sphingomonas sp. OTU376 TaxID=3043863 RepID=UPI00313C789B
MIAEVSAWKQAGSLYIWRYAALSGSRRGWHFHADRDGCASIIDLIDRMVGQEVPSHRTMGLAPVTPAIWGRPNFGSPKWDRFERLRVEYCPEQAALEIEPVENRLILRIGAERAPLLREAFIDLMLGQNDFGIGPSDARRPDPWMFW